MISPIAMVQQQSRGKRSITSVWVRAFFLLLKIQYMMYYKLGFRTFQKQIIGYFQNKSVF
jgi:hypothetical protein